MADPSAPRRLAEAALAREPKSAWLHYLLGLAHFREGRLERALEDLSRSLELSDGWSAAPLNYPVLAMAHHRLGHVDEGRRWLDEAHGRHTVSSRGVDPGGGLSPSAGWWDRVEFQLLLREADSTVFGPEIPADPFAP